MNKKDIVDCLVDITIENDVDLLVLAEYQYNIDNLCQAMNNSSCRKYKAIPNIDCERLKIIANKTYGVDPLRDDKYYNILRIRTSPKANDVIVAMIHNRSKMYEKTDEQRKNVQEFHRAIVDSEREEEIERTIAIGDFNIDPFETLCFGSAGMHALPYRNLIEKRKTKNESGKKFYNPTWKFYGRTQPPFSTYHCANGGMHNFYWYVFDQVMISRSLLDAFQDENLKIITETSNYKLLTKRANLRKKEYGDHLPLFCSLKEELI